MGDYRSGLRFIAFTLPLGTIRSLAYFLLVIEEVFDMRVSSECADDGTNARSFAGLFSASKSKL